MKWYARDSQLEAKRDALERAADALLQADARRRNALARQSKPKSKPIPAPTPSRWMPLGDLARVLRRKERAARS
jgi:hypothetical protein